jgi:hypothetical protein
MYSIHRTAKNQNWKFETFIHRTGIALPQSQFPLQRTNAENSKQIFPEQELHCHSPNFHIHVFLWAIYIQYSHKWSAYSAAGICGPILGIYKSLTDIWMWKLRLRPHNSQKRNTLMGFLLQCAFFAIKQIEETKCFHKHCIDEFRLLSDRIFFSIRNTQAKL